MEISNKGTTDQARITDENFERSLDISSRDNDGDLKLKIIILERRLKNSDKNFLKAQNKLDKLNDTCQSLLAVSATKTEIYNLRFLIWISIIFSCLTSALIIAKAM